MKPGASPREQRCSNLLTRDENEHIFTLFAPKCESLATTVVQIFTTAAPGHRDWIKLDAGVLCLIKDHLKRSYYFRVYCPDRQSLIWEHEVYKSMQYNAPSPFLHTFEAQDSIIAFNFVSEEEAQWLRGVLLEKLESKNQRQERRIQNQYHPKDPANKTKTRIAKDSKKKNKKKDEKKKLTKADIGAPTNFCHVSHNGKEVSPELRAFFQQASISDDQLQDSATREFIYKFIDHNGGFDRVVSEVSQNEKSVRESRHERRLPPLPVSNRVLPPPPSSWLLPATPPAPPSRTKPVPNAPLPEAPPTPPPPPMPLAPLTTPPHPAPDKPSEPPSLDTHSALMESIRSGPKLKSVVVESETKRSSSDPRGQLLSQIIQGVTLKPPVKIEKRAESGVGGNSLAEALAEALRDRRTRMSSDSSDSSGSEDEYDDDDEWEA